MAHPLQKRTFGQRRNPPRVTIARGGRVHTFTLRPWLVGTVATVLSAVFGGAMLSGAYMIYRDDIMDAAIAKQVELQYAYEDRIALLRSEIDRVTSRQAVKAGTIDERVTALLDRQEMLRSRQVLLERLVARAGEEGVAVGGEADDAAGVEGPATTASTAPSEFDPLAYAPVAASAADAATRAVIRARKPRTATAPAAATLPARPSSVRQPGRRPMAGADPLDAIKGVQSEIERSERAQTAVLGHVRDKAAREADRIETVARRLGLRLPETATEAVGGPFIAAPGFVDDVSATAETLSRLGLLRKATAAWPIRSPLPGARRTSGFGYRTDPFLGRTALHSGLDLRAPFGTPIKAAAAGRVVHAGWRGGYGNLVEVDHGNGMTTRYGHMSAISVAVGDRVEVGAKVGELGSTGRSTGPHLHYETRVDGVAVDPTRYLGALKGRS